MSVKRRNEYSLSSQQSHKSFVCLQAGWTTNIRDKRVRNQQEQSVKKFLFILIIFTSLIILFTVETRFIIRTTIKTKAYKSKAILFKIKFPKKISKKFQSNQTLPVGDWYVETLK